MVDLPTPTISIRSLLIAFFKIVPPQLRNLGGGSDNEAAGGTAGSLKNRFDLVLFSSCAEGLRASCKAQDSAKNAAENIEVLRGLISQDSNDVNANRLQKLLAAAENKAEPKKKAGGGKGKGKGGGAAGAAGAASKQEEDSAIGSADIYLPSQGSAGAAAAQSSQGAKKRKRGGGKENSPEEEEKPAKKGKKPKTKK